MKLLLVLLLALPQEPQVDISVLMERVGERAQQYYERLQKLAWTNTSRDQILKDDGTPKHKPTEAAYDMILRLQPPKPDDNFAPFYLRSISELKILDGKAVKKGTSPKADDPASAASVLGLIGFLMRPSPGYSFSYAGQGTLDGRKTLIVDVTYPQILEPNRVEWDKSSSLAGVKRDFQIVNSLPEKGQLWIDANTYDVVRFESRSKPFEFSRTETSRKITYQVEVTARMKSISFENPTETFLVPESIEAIRSYKGADDPTIRQTHTFDGWKRFSGEIKITPLGEEAK